MTQRYFVFVYPEKSKTQALLDLAIYLLNPDEKWPAHVTVAGPFPNRRYFSLQNNLLDTTVFTLSRGNFFKYHSNTVFLNVGFREREHVWRKPDFRGNPIPHLTLYDGPDEGLARTFFDALEGVPLQFSFHARDLHIVNALAGQQRGDLRLAVDLKQLEGTRSFSLDGIKLLSASRRLELAVDALKRISGSPVIAGRA